MKIKRTITFWITVILILVLIQGNSLAVSAENSQNPEEYTDLVEESGIRKNSMLPLTEVKAYLILNGYSEDELKKMPVDTILEKLLDADGEHISIDRSATTVWRYLVKDGERAEQYESYAIGKDEVMDLSKTGDVYEYGMELIVGSGGQMNPGNIRYEVKVYISDHISEKFQFQLYTETRVIEPVREEFVQSDSPLKVSSGSVIPAWNYVYYMDDAAWSDTLFNPVYLKGSSQLNERPDIELKILETQTDSAGNRKDVTEQFFTDGYQMSVDSFSHFSSFLVFYYIDGVQCDVIMLNILLPSNSSEIKADLFTVENGKKINVVEKTNYSFQMQSDSEHADKETYECVLTGGYSADSRYYISMDAVISQTIYQVAGTVGGGITILPVRETKDGNNTIEKVVVGHYDSLAEASDAENVWEDTFGDSLENRKSWNFSGDGVEFTFFFKEGETKAFGEVMHLIIKAKNSKTAERKTDAELSPEAPVFFEKDPWFRVTGIRDSGGKDADAYVVENGENINRDTMYGYGYQTILVGGDTERFKPVIQTADPDLITVKSITVDGRKYGVDEYLSFSGNQSVISAEYQVEILDLNGRHTRQYHVAFVRKCDGKKLYAAGMPVLTEREIILNKDSDYIHDIFLANIGSRKLTDLWIDLDASNTVLDKYWTIGGNNNDELEAFPENLSAEASKSSQGVLANTAKIRLVLQGKNCGNIRGTLKIYSGAEGDKAHSELLVSISLTGYAGDQKEETESKEQESSAAETEKEKLSIKDCEISLKTRTYIYNGKERKPGAVLKYKKQILKEGVDYSVKYSNNTNAGTGKVTIKGKGNYTGTALRTFTIKKADNKITASSITKTWKSTSQSFSINAGVKGKTKLTYTSNQKNVTVSSSGRVTVKGKFTGTAVITIKAAATSNYEAAVKKISVTVKPLQTALSAITNPKAGKLYACWKKNISGSGYQIQCSTSRTFSGAVQKTISGNTVTSVQFSVKKGKTYYVRIRTVKKSGNKTYYSGWSSVKTLKIRK